MVQAVFCLGLSMFCLEPIWMGPGILVWFYQLAVPLLSHSSPISYSLTLPSAVEKYLRYNVETIKLSAEH